MEQSTKNILGGVAVLAIVAIVAIGYCAYVSYRSVNSEEKNPQEETATEQSPLVEETADVNGKKQAPSDFPEDIPLETSQITESNTVRYPNTSASQLSVSYISAQSVASKYSEYKAYMQSQKYSIRETKAGSVQAIFGENESANLSVAVSASPDGTLVQVSYLMKPSLEE